MNRTAQFKRLLVVMTVLGAAFAGLGFRLFDLHVLRHPDLLTEAERNRERVIHRQGRRGAIQDVNGGLLANSVPVRIVVADPMLTRHRAGEIAGRLAPMLNISAAELTEKLSRPGRYVRLKQKVDEETAQAIRDLKYKGIFFEDQLVRLYPNGPVGAHVVGFVDFDHKGVQGIESSMNEYLSGVAGYEVIERDRKGREIRANRIENIGPRDGYNVVLTIDQVIQHIAESALAAAMAEHKPKAGLVIVTRPATGEILAMASHPTFDPNNPGESHADSRRNRCISDVAEPGSTFKVVTIAGAVNDRAVNLYEKVDCENGAWLYAGRILHDAHPHGLLSVEEVIYKSSNIGSAKIALRIGPSRLHQYIRAFGFGQRTGIALPGEVSGIARPVSRWSKLSISRIPMGHEIAATPLQLLMAVNAVGNGGRLMKPMIVRSVMDADGNEVTGFAPQVRSRCIDARASMLMTTALRRVTQEGGTGTKAAVDKHDVAGKTGTAQKIENGQYVRKYYSSFVGYLPAGDPQISILVTLDDPSGRAYYGGSVAGPVFKEVAEKTAQYLGIPPQLTQETQVAGNL
jgi:cell division protein FtsI/penicillin-binding protein 2